MGVASTVMREVASTVLRDEAAAAVEAAGDVSPVEKLQVLLTNVRRGNVPEVKVLKKRGNNNTPSDCGDVFFLL